MPVVTKFWLRLGSLRLEPFKICEAFLHDTFPRFAGLNLLMQLQEHRAVFLQFVTVQVRGRECPRHLRN